MFFHGPARHDDSSNGHDLASYDPGTTEIWQGDALIALVATTPTVDPDTYDERWALFHGGATDSDGNALGTYPFKDLPPEYHPSSPFLEPVYARRAPATASWSNLHLWNGSLAQFRAAALGAVTTTFNMPVGGGVAANADWIDGVWTTTILTQALIQQYVAGEHKAGGAINRWFEGRRGGAQIALSYAEHRTNTLSRVVHQVSKPPAANGHGGMNVADGEIGIFFYGQGGTHTLSTFLNLAKTKQNQGPVDDRWIYTRGTCTWHD